MEDNNKLNWLSVSKTYRKCPRCKHGELDMRVKRNKLVKSFLFWLETRRYACNSCGRKVYLVGKAGKGVSNYFTAF